MQPQAILTFPNGLQVADLDDPAQPEQSLQCNFSIPNRGDIAVDISIRPNHNPKAYGLDLLFPTIPLDTFSGFPVCEGIVHCSPDNRGYASMYGWTQLWKQDDEDWRFDWAPVQTGLNWPFIWFGPEPRLFDGPTRVGVTNLDWTARSFVTYIDDSLMTRCVQCVVGFEWGFWIRDGKIAIKPLKRLESTDWDTFGGYLRETFPGWEFKGSQ